MHTRRGSKRLSVSRCGETNGGRFSASSARSVASGSWIQVPAVRELSRVLVPGESLVIGDLGRWSAWNLHRWMRGRMGDPLWSQARFWSRRTLDRLLRHAHLDPEGWTMRCGS